MQRERRSMVWDHPRVAGAVPESHPLREDAWLAGFADGEASFTIAILRGARFPAGCFQVRLELCLRDDDRLILHDLRDAFGGALKVKHNKLGNPGLTWVAGSKASLRALVDYFDTFPLRAKKRADYAIWREAALLYIEEGYRAPGLVAYRDQLTAVRLYQEA